jgi:hypothetical protein
MKRSSPVLDGASPMECFAMNKLIKNAVDLPAVSPVPFV